MVGSNLRDLPAGGALGGKPQAFHLAAAALHRGGAARVADRLWGDQRLTVLAYHRIGHADSARRSSYATNISATPDLFDRQMHYVARHFSVVDLAAVHQFIAHGVPLPPRPLLITFDDGYRDNFEYALPILRKYNLPAVIFLITEQLGNPSPPWWDECAYYFARTPRQSVDLPLIGTCSLASDRERDAALERLIASLKGLREDAQQTLMRSVQEALGVEDRPHDPRLFMTWDEVRVLVANNIACQPHTLTHPILSHLDHAEMLRQIAESRQRVESETQQPALAFAYPNGSPADYNREAVELLGSLGYSVGFTMTRGPVDLDLVRDRPFEVPRIFVGHWDNLHSFALKVSGLLALPARLSQWRQDR
ncbi:MAG: polysaccharide deacetylase family protein [Anaerolineae bacterium]